MSGLSICVFCASSSRIDPQYVELAAEVGAELARRGHSLVTGGATVSSMGAVAAAARSGGARTVGVIPESMDDGELPDHANDELVVTADMRSRKGEMDRRSDAFLVLAGGLGTLEELFEIWTSRVLGIHDKPLVILDPHDLYAPLRTLMEHLHTEGFARPRALEAVEWTGSVEDAFDLLERPGEQLRPTDEERAEAQP